MFELRVSYTHAWQFLSLGILQDIVMVQKVILAMCRISVGQPTVGQPIWETFHRLPCDAHKGEQGLLFE